LTSDMKFIPEFSNLTFSHNSKN